MRIVLVFKGNLIEDRPIAASTRLMDITVLVNIIHNYKARHAGVFNSINAM